MSRQIIAAIGLMVWVTSVSADRAQPDPTKVQGSWEVVRVDVGTGGNQARFTPDGPIIVRIDKAGLAEIASNGRLLAKGRVTADAKGKFQFDADGDVKASLTGTWGGDGKRLIVSFEFQSVPTSILLHPHVPAVPAKAEGDGKGDPWVGTYSAYELSYARSPDGLYSPSKRHGGKITIARKGDYYTVDFAPEVKLRKVNERLLDAGDNSSAHPRWVALRVEDGQRVLEVQSSFHSIHLIQGKVPKTWKLAPE